MGELLRIAGSKVEPDTKWIRASGCRTMHKHCLNPLWFLCIAKLVMWNIQSIHPPYIIETKSLWGLCATVYNLNILYLHGTQSDPAACYGLGRFLMDKGIDKENQILPHWLRWGPQRMGHLPSLGAPSVLCDFGQTQRMEKTTFPLLPLDFIGGKCHRQPGHLLLQLPLCPPLGRPEVNKPSPLEPREAFKVLSVSRDLRFWNHGNNCGKLP